MRLLCQSVVLAGMLLTPGASRAQDDAARAQAAYARAVDLEAKGNHPAALSLLWEAAGLAPRDAGIQNRLGEALDRIGALDAAAEAFRLAVAANPDLRKASINLIMTLVKLGKGEDAVAYARQQVAARPDDADSYFALGLAQSEQNVDGSIVSFRRALERSPQHALAHYNLALVLRRADRLSEAIEALQRTLAIAPRAEAHYTLGVIYWHQGELERARRALAAALDVEPRYADAQYALGSVLKSERKWAAAAEALRRAIALRPDQPAAWYTLAQVLSQAGDERGARAALAEAERLRRVVQLEREALTWTAVGIQQVQAGHLERALSHFQQAITVFEPYAPAHYQMGLALARLNRADEARAAFARAQALNPSLVSPRDTRDKQR
jgi:tetratricopeptide (TPR) repeat protein